MCPYSRFVESDSSTLNQTKHAFNVQYGSGSAKGSVAYDTVTISNNLTSPNQVLGLASTTQGMSGPSVSYDRASGILGLGFQALLRDPNEDTFILNLQKNKVIKEPVFSIYLNRQDDYGYTGEIVIGGYETQRFTGTLNFLPIIAYDNTGKPNIGRSYGDGKGAYKYWTVPGQSVASYSSDGSKLYETQFYDVQPVILDTGTTLSYLPEATVLEILALITPDFKPLKLNNGEIQAYQVNCSAFLTEDKWFDFEFSPNPKAFSNNPVIIRVPLKELVLPQNTNNIHTASSCLFGIAPISTGFLSSVGSGWILGQTVLRSAYVVHDMLGLQVGVGAADNGYHSPTFDNQSSLLNIRTSLNVFLFFAVILLIH